MKKSTIIKPEEARRAGLTVETHQKYGAATNKHSTTAVVDQRKLDQETEAQRHKQMSLKVSQTIQQGRQEKGLSQTELATRINEKVQIIKDYEKGIGIPSQEILRKIERVLGVKLRGKDINLSSKTKNCGERRLDFGPYPVLISKEEERNKTLVRTFEECRPDNGPYPVLISKEEDKKEREKGKKIPEKKESTTSPLDDFFFSPATEMGQMKPFVNYHLHMVSADNLAGLEKGEKHTKTPEQVPSLQLPNDSLVSILNEELEKIGVNYYYQDEGKLTIMSRFIDSVRRIDWERMDDYERIRIWNEQVAVWTDLVKS